MVDLVAPVVAALLEVADHPGCDIISLLGLGLVVLEYLPGQPPLVVDVGCLEGLSPGLVPQSSHPTWSVKLVRRRVV